MAIVGTRSGFSDGTHNYVSMGTTDELVRMFGNQNGFTRVRLGLLWAINGNATFSLVQSPFGGVTGAVPMSSTQGVKSATTTWFMGWMGAGDGFGNQTWTYNVGPPAYYSGTFSNFAQKSGASFTNLGGAVPGTFYVAVAGQGLRSWILVDLWKDTPNLEVYLPTTPAMAQTDWNMSDLLYGVEQNRRGATVSMRGTSIAAYHGVIAQPEQGSPLDSFSYSWNNTSLFPMEIYGYAAWASY